jgi:hypothetical protein
MNAPISDAGAVARLALLAAAALALTACQTGRTGPTAADAPKTETAAATTAAAAPKHEAAEPPEPVKDVEPMTHARAARECWMRTEKGSAHENLDKRADIVNKCIDEKMKAAASPTPKS